MPSLDPPRILGSMAFNFSMGVTEGPEAASVMTTGGSRGGVRKGGGESLIHVLKNSFLRGGFKDFFFHPYLGEDSQFE